MTAVKRTIKCFIFSLFSFYFPGDSSVLSKVILLLAWRMQRLQWPSPTTAMDSASANHDNTIQTTKARVSWRDWAYIYHQREIFKIKNGFIIIISKASVKVCMEATVIIPGFCISGKINDYRYQFYSSFRWKSLSLGNSEVVLSNRRQGQLLIL